MLLANQRLPDRNQILGGNNVSFEINFREKKIFKCVQMVLPKKNFEMLFFCDRILLAEAAVPLFNRFK